MSQSSSNKDEFPVFKDADVLIVSPTGRFWRLHSRVLANGSDVLRDIFAKNVPARIRREDKLEGNLIQWKLHMIKNYTAALADSNGAHYVDFMAVDPHKNKSVILNMLNGTSEPPKFNTIYDNLFRVFYNLKPDFTPDGDVGIDDEAAPMYEALNLLTAAGYLRAYPSVRLVIESHLLGFNQLLWYEIEHRPEVWASVACKLQSANMFREAMLHLAGRYHLRGSDGVKQHLLATVEWGAAILELVKQKARELKDYKLQTERYLFEFVPERMVHEAKVQIGGTVAPGRAVYANDVYWWMALHLIRQYFSCAILQNQHHRAADGGMAFYRTIACPHSYLLDNSLEGFHIMFSMTPKSRVVFIHALNELKKDVAPVVAGLLVNHSQAQKPVDAAPYKYLTCTVVLDEELPWADKPSTLETAETQTIHCSSITPVSVENCNTMEIDRTNTYTRQTNNCTPVSGGNNPLFVSPTSSADQRQTHGTENTTPATAVYDKKTRNLQNQSMIQPSRRLGQSVPQELPPDDVKFTPAHINPSTTGMDFDGATRESIPKRTFGSLGEAMTSDGSHGIGNMPISHIAGRSRRLSWAGDLSGTNPVKKVKLMSPQLIPHREPLGDRSIHAVLDNNESIISSVGHAASSPATSTSSIPLSTQNRADFEMNSKTAHILAGALALKLLPANQEKEINAKAQQAHDRGVPRMQALLEKPYGKTNREGLNVKFRAFVEAGMMGYGKRSGEEVGKEQIGVWGSWLTRLPTLIKWQESLLPPLRVLQMSQ